MDLSIVIVNFNTFQPTCDCLASVFAFIKNIQYEVILVDNGSTDVPPRKFSELFPDVRLIESSENIGFAGANNLGMRQASGKYLLLLNPDTLVIDDSIQRCTSFMESEEAKEIGLLGARLLNPDLTYQPSAFPYLKNSLWIYLITNNPLAHKIVRILKLDRHENFNPSKSQFVGDISGAFMFLRKNVAVETRYFDTDFFMFCEDTEWCRGRIGKASRIYYYAEATIVHIGGQSAPKDLMYIQSRLSLSLYWYKTGWLNYTFYILISYLNVLTTFLLFPFFSQNGKVTAAKFLKAHVRLFPYLFTSIPKFPRAINSRKEPLVYEPAKKSMNLS